MLYYNKPVFRTFFQLEQCFFVSTKNNFNEKEGIIEINTTLPDMSFGKIKQPFSDSVRFERNNNTIFEIDLFHVENCHKKTITLNTFPGMFQ